MREHTCEAPDLMGPPRGERACSSRGRGRDDDRPLFRWPHVPSGMFVAVGACGLLVEDATVEPSTADGSGRLGRYGGGEFCPVVNWVLDSVDEHEMATSGHPLSRVMSVLASEVERSR